MNRHSQQGSALLIVLGFLSFMVVSAVAFAIWMRNERLPSSALRRSVANRYLVKAALAQAMSRVDDAIRSHAYPGAWYTNNQSSVHRDGNNQAFDWWESRVFMPPDPEGARNPDSSGTDFPRTAPATKTVSVLNFEALGYLPPAIANDVRLLARSSWAAKWDYFNYDAGRYAFCAVDVSDFLDISKMAADAPRTSAAAEHAQKKGEKPTPSRFSLAYLFRKDNFSGPSGMPDFDARVHTAPGQGEWPDAPLVSMMDYNLSVGKQSMGSLWSPFFKLACGDNNSRFFYIGANAGNLYVEAAARQPFVTSSWFPPSDSEFAKSDGTPNTPLDLSLRQPFKIGTMKNGAVNMAFTQTAEDRDNGGGFWQTMLNNGKLLCQLDELTLFDYLDEDNVPLSLAMPCAERVPMITSLAPVGNVAVELTAPDMTNPSDTEELGNTRRKKYYDAKIKITPQSLALRSTLLFPFRDGKAPVGCTVQAFARLVFVGEAAAAGGGAAAAGAILLRNKGFAQNFRPLSQAEWTTPVADDKQFKLEEGASDGNVVRTPAEKCLCVTFPAEDESWTPRATMPNVQACWEDKLLRLKSGVPLEQTIVRRIQYYNVTPPTPANPNGTETPDGPPKYEVVLRPFDASGKVVEIPAGEIEQTAFTALQYSLRPYLVVWVRVVQDGKTVDMVPATYEDDLAFNGIDNSQALGATQINIPLGNNKPEDPVGNLPDLPIMRFPGTTSFTYADADAGTAPPPNEWSVKSCYAVDPRYNWAPENWWFDEADGNPTGQKWHAAVFNDGGILDKMAAEEFGGDYGRADRANDPFLFVSNLGYLQSVGELAFLPRLSYMNEDGGEPTCLLGEKKETVEGGSNDGSLYDGNPRTMPTTAPDQGIVATMPCALSAWRSYQSYRTNPKEDTFEFGANLYRRGLVNGSQGFYVNPYTQNQEVMLAALANAPLNYWVAGTNYTAQGKTVLNTFSSYKDLMFSDNGSGYAHMTKTDINKIATFLRHRFEDLASMIEVPGSTSQADRYVYQKVWEDMYDALDWGGTLDCTVREVYNDLKSYYSGGNGSGNNYRLAYTKRNGYSGLNRFVRGGNSPDPMSTGIRLNTDRVIHTDELDLYADPFRGQYAGNAGDTTCYNNLFDIDRMFLHSYWRDCFANRQQLFLIFVRAESTALGGAGEGTPAQQGGRAVALVWRDPMPPTGSDVYDVESQGYEAMDAKRHPHRMRVLFYRQFD